MWYIIRSISIFHLFIFLRLPTSTSSGAEICQLEHISIPAWMHRIYNLWMQLDIFLIVKTISFYMSSCTEIDLESILWHPRIYYSNHHMAYIFSNLHSTMVFIYLFLDIRFKWWIFDKRKTLLLNDGQPRADV